MRSHLIVRVGVLVAAVACAAAAPAYAQGVLVDSDTFGGLGARAIGPATMSGRISALDAVAGDRLTIYAGSAGGGLWRSVDGCLRRSRYLQRLRIVSGQQRRRRHELR